MDRDKSFAHEQHTKHKTLILMYEPCNMTFKTTSALTFNFDLDEVSIIRHIDRFVWQKLLGGKTLTVEITLKQYDNSFNSSKSDYITQVVWMLRTDCIKIIKTRLNPFYPLFLSPRNYCNVPFQCDINTCP